MWQEKLARIEQGKLRAAFFENGEWRVNREVKEAIIAAFRAGKLISYAESQSFSFIDKDSLPPRKFGLESGLRIVPGGSSVRSGAYVAPSVVIMPPSYVNVGAYIDSGSLVDSHVLVGSCAQIGKNVHLSAGVQIGGVLEPVGERPVIIEDDCFIGAGSVIVEGVLIKKGAVLAPGVVLSRSVPVYDCIKERRLEISEPIPENAVLVPGSRPLSSGLNWAAEHGLMLQCAIIIKYRDEKTSAALALETLLRSGDSNGN
jgi:2,3,4,5-tetrahydropyridine-2-carboxylate N-succinyltransferase